MELRQLRHAIALAEHRNFVRAADALGITQSALSRSIQALEGSVGVRLFDRGTRDVEPTLFGRLLLDHARKMDLVASDLDRELQMARGLESGDLSVGAGPYGGAMLVGAVVGRLSQRHPKLRANVVVGPYGEMPDRLRARTIDLSVADLHTLGENQEFETLDLLPHPLFFVVRAGHPLASAGAPRIADVLQYPLASVRPQQARLDISVSRMPAELDDVVHRPRAIAVTCDSTPLLKDVVRNSDAVTALCPFMVADELQSGTLRMLPGIDVGAPICFGVAWLRGRTLSPPAQAFIELLVEHDRELAEFERARFERIEETGARKR